jgi:uncharacterized protein (TIGR02596 family)
MKHNQPAFTLIEMLVVIAIVFMLLTLTVVGTGHLIQATRLAEASLMIENSLQLAGQRAALEDREIEIRFFELPAEPGLPPLYQAFQIFGYEIETDPARPNYNSPTTPAFHPQPVALGPLQRLPSTIALHASGSFSTLLTDPSRISTPSTTNINGIPCQTRRLRFLPRGGTDLSPSITWTLLLCESSNATSAALPPNHSVLRINPSTARITRFRPE